MAWVLLLMAAATYAGTTPFDEGRAAHASPRQVVAWATANGTYAKFRNGTHTPTSVRLILPGQKAKEVHLVPRRATRLSRFPCIGCQVAVSGSRRSFARQTVTTRWRGERSHSDPGTSPLTWSPPRLDHPEVVEVSDQHVSLHLDATRDYVVQMPDQPVTRWGVSITGGRNIVLIGGHIRIPWRGAKPANASRRGLTLRGQTGTVHVEGLLIDGPDLSEGIDLDERLGAVVQLQNIRIGTVRARDTKRFTDTHPDLLQTWGGPRELRVDGFTGSTQYQAFFLHPTQYDRRAKLSRAVLRRVNVDASTSSAEAFWQATPFPLSLSDVWVSAGAAKVFHPRPAAWGGVGFGSPPDGDFVPAGTAGVDYRSPGYRGASG